MNENKTTDNSTSDTAIPIKETKVTANGKGSSPRNNLSNTFRENYENIDWSNKIKTEENFVLPKSKKT